ncbi:helix-turn-helix domain-containing protein [Novacetimonas pomaceti]|uniref:HTH araC/xylS-type domain-containing protein n=1 Tax=Novacetimonas pomaceti TaxID=2021998 RepID=A0ABX5P069_9PROT|nr:AraC family transcriptional regulator [Novacetimonas pomaceti]MBV1834978.1 AraC family transcriptional regulator [Novacetimonas pomaceti]PYD47169.1 hypothetical protein C3920_11300 [Novacetimonas pomaceti]
MLGCPTHEQRLEAGRLPRHRHGSAYVSLLLDGAYGERGPGGRWPVEPGQLIAHAAFECHDNEIARPGAWIINIPVPARMSLPPVFTIEDPDALIVAARQGVPVLGYLRPVSVVSPRNDDWPDALAALLRRRPVSITRWARETGLAPATVSRGFLAAFGVSPSRYRLENQLLQAMRLIATTNAPLAAISGGCGFADQAHFCRTVRAASGYSPREWRVKSIQDDAMQDW